jgi:hypothetical protein
MCAEELPPFPWLGWRFGRRFVCSLSAASPTRTARPAPHACRPCPACAPPCAPSVTRTPRYYYLVTMGDGLGTRYLLSRQSVDGCTCVGTSWRVLAHPAHAFHAVFMLVRAMHYALSTGNLPLRETSRESPSIHAGLRHMGLCVSSSVYAGLRGVGLGGPCVSCGLG